MRTPMPELDSRERRTVADMMVQIARNASDNYLKTEIEAERFAECGNFFRVYECEKDHHKFKFKHSCNSRICEKCNRRYYYQIKNKFYDSIKPFWANRAKTYGPKFLTLTWASSEFAGNFPTPGEFKKCRKQAAHFLRWYYGKYKMKVAKSGNIYATKVWRGAGGLSVMEVGAHGNLHCHALVYGPYIPQKTLSDSWRSITGSSFIVDIRQAKDPKKAIAYIMKYITKPPNSDSYDDIAMWAVVIKGSRRLATYGVLYGQIVKVKREDRFPMVCIYCGTKLKYHGVGRDPENVLIPWLDYQKYVDHYEGQYVKTYFNHSPDQDYKMQLN